MHSGIPWLTGDDRGVQGVTGDVYRGAKGSTGYTVALYNGTQGMYSKKRGVTGEGRGFSYGHGFLEPVV